MRRYSFLEAKSSYFFLFLNLFILLELQVSQTNKFLASPYPLNIRQEDICTKNPEKVKYLVSLGERIGVNIKKGTPKLNGMDATYEAFDGRLGEIVVTRRKLHPVAYCQLITHEFMHVLQHLNGGLKIVKPLDLKLTYSQIYTQTSLQEAEAYAYQNLVGKIYYLLNEYIEIK